MVMDTKKLQEVIVSALEDIKAREITVINTMKLTALFECIVIASADSARQAKSLARNVEEKVREAGGEIIGVEGEETGDWILVDCADAVVHIMQPAVRSYYNLEELWQLRPSRREVPRLGESEGQDSHL